MQRRFSKYHKMERVHLQRGILSLSVFGGCFLLLLFAISWLTEMLSIPEIIRSIVLNSEGFCAEFNARRISRFLLYCAALTILAYPLFRKTKRRLGSYSVCIAILAIALGILLRIDLWWTKPFYGDSFALKAGIISQSFTQLLTGPVGFNQSAPVGFVLISKAIGELSSYDNRALTLMPLLCGIVSIFLFSKLLSRARMVLGKPLFLFLFAVNPSLVLYSADFKPYGVDLLVSLLCINVLLSFSEGKRPWKTFAALCSISPLFSMPSFFLLPVSFIYVAHIHLWDPIVIWWRNRAEERVPWKAVKPVFICAAITIGIGLPVFLHTVRTMPSSMEGWWSRYSTFAPLSFSRDALLWYIRNFVMIFRGPVYFTFLPYRFSAIQIGLSLLPLLTFAIGISRGRKNSITLTFLGVSALTLLASALRLWPIYPGAASTTGRLLLFLVPFFLLILGEGMEVILRRFRVFGIVLAIFAACSTSAHFCAEAPPAWDAEKSADFLQTSMASHDELILEPTTLAILLSTNFRWTSSLEKRMAIHMLEPETLNPSLEQVAAQATDKAWLYLLEYDSPIYHNLQANSYLASNGWTYVRSDFPGIVFNRSPCSTDASETELKLPGGSR